MNFCVYSEPNRLEVCVGEMVGLRPLSHLEGCIFAAAPRFPRGVALDMQSGLVYGRPEELTLGEVTYFVTACDPGRFPLTVIHVAGLCFGIVLNIPSFLLREPIHK